MSTCISKFDLIRQQKHKSKATTTPLFSTDDYQQYNSQWRTGILPSCDSKPAGTSTDECDSWSLLISIIFIVIFCVVAWFASPKGETQTVWRSTLVLSAWACWLMWGTYRPGQWDIAASRTCLRSGGHLGSVQWDRGEGRQYGDGVTRLTYGTAITFLAQWHPLITPERADLRPEYVNGPAKSNGAMM